MGDMSGEGPVEVLGTGRFARFIRRNGWEFCERLRVGGIVAVAGLTREGEIVLVSQWREPVQRVVVELPAGLAGDETALVGESLLAAAQREMLEETGYGGGRWEVVAEGPPSSGLSSEMVTFFHVVGLWRQGAGGGKGGERIMTHLVPLCGLAEWLGGARGKGWVVDPKVYAGAWFLSDALDEGDVG